MATQKKYSDKNLDDLAAEILADHKSGALKAMLKGKGGAACEIVKKLLPYVDKFLPIMKMFKPNWAAAVEAIKLSLQDACPGS